MGQGSEYLFTIGDAGQVAREIKGIFMRGRREPRVAFVGRSNVGKSSLLNALLGETLARVSKQPGKTAAIHLFWWRKTKLILADFPGYGYAKKSKEERERWSHFISTYIKGDAGLQGILMLLDARHDPSEEDAAALDFLSFHRLPITLVFTKSDQIRGQAEMAKRQNQMAKWMKAQNFEGPSFWISVEPGHRLGKEGLKQLIRFLEGETR